MFFPFSLPLSNYFPSLEINYASKQINFLPLFFSILIAHLSLSISLQDLHDCGAPCHAMFFPERERTVLRYWVGSWAAVCVASCLFTVSNISVFRFSDFPIFLYQFCHFPFAILMRHNVRHSIFNLMAINHARQKCSSLCCSSSFPLR